MDDVTLDVGDGIRNLRVHGSYEAISLVQSALADLGQLWATNAQLLFDLGNTRHERDRLRAALELALEADLGPRRREAIMKALAEQEAPRV